MKNETYETPQITVLGEVTDMTQKGGIFFDFPGAAEGKGTPPPPGAPGTFS
jgi:hypothetical protein